MSVDELMQWARDLLYWAELHGYPYLILGNHRTPRSIGRGSDHWYDYFATITVVRMQRVAERLYVYSRRHHYTKRNGYKPMYRKK